MVTLSFKIVHRYFVKETKKLCIVLKILFKCTNRHLHLRFARLYKKPFQTVNRNTASATSLALPILPIGISPLMISKSSALKDSSMEVEIAPGATAFTRIPFNGYFFA